MTPQAVPEPARMSEAARLTGVIFDPKAAFADIAARPRWWVPLVLLSILSLAFMYAYSERVGWERFMRQTIESSPRTQSLTAEQRERIIQQQVRFGSVFGYAGAAVGVAVSSLVVAGLLTLVFVTLLGAELRFRQVFAVTCYASLPGVFATGLAIVMLFLKHPDDFDLRNPTAFNIGAYLDPQATAKWLYSVATSIDLFTIWTLLLLSFGLSVAARRLSFSRSLGVVGMLWVVWVLLKMGWAAIFS